MISNIVHHIASYRASKGLTLEQFGEKANLSPALLSMLENDQRRPTDQVLRRIANAYPELKPRIIATMFPGVETAVLEPGEIR